MAEQYYKVEPENRHTDWTAGVVTEKDEAGNPTKVVPVGVPTELSAEDREAVEALGFTVNESSAEEAEEAGGGAEGFWPTDTTNAAPVFGSSGVVNQNTDDDDNE